MSNDEKYIELIEGYIDGTLNDEELRKFEENLKTNKNLQKQVELHKDIRQAIIKKGKVDLKQELNTYYEDYIKANKKKRNLRILIPAISVAASILILIFVFIGNEKTTDSPEQLITLDTAGVNQPSEYADSAIFNDSVDVDMIEENDD